MEVNAAVYKYEQQQQQQRSPFPLKEIKQKKTKDIFLI